jgi:Ca2+/H+ antiporter
MSSINNRGSDLDPEAEAGLLVISRGTAILLLLTYIAYLFFQVSLSKLWNQSSNFFSKLKTHPDLFEPTDQTEEEEEEEEPKMNVAAAATGCVSFYFHFNHHLHLTGSWVSRLSPPSALIIASCSRIPILFI